MDLPSQLAVPSGRILTQSDILLLAEMSDSKSVVHRDKTFTLKSKIESHIYAFLRGELTDSPRLLNMVGQKIALTVNENTALGDRQPNLIGLPTAGTAIAVAASMASMEMHLKDPNFPLIACRVMRENLKKTHGANDRWVNGETSGQPNLDKFTFWTVDNVATDGKTKLEAAEQLEQDGYPSKDMPQLIFVDRQQGAVVRLEAAGFKRIVVCYNLLDITYAYGELGIWPTYAVEQVEEEIAAHQFV